MRSISLDWAMADEKSEEHTSTPRVEFQSSVIDD
jgi:hypothetical protein